MKDVYQSIDESIQFQEENEKYGERRRVSDRQSRRKSRPLQLETTNIGNNVDSKYHSDLGAIKRSRVGKARQNSYIPSSDPYGPSPRWSENIAVPLGDPDLNMPSPTVIFNIPCLRKSRTRESKYIIPASILLILTIFLCLNQILMSRFRVDQRGNTNTSPNIKFGRIHDIHKNTTTDEMESLSHEDLIKKALIRASSVQDSTMLDMNFDLDDMT